MTYYTSDHARSTFEMQCLEQPRRLRHDNVQWEAQELLGAMRRACRAGFGYRWFAGERIQRPAMISLTC